MERITHIILNFLFPAYCIGCRKRGVALCYPCMKEIPEARTPPDANTHAVFAYQNKVIKKALWELKYRGRTIIAKQCAGMLYDRMLEELSDMRTFHDFTDPVLIPIPLSAKRLRERGFNQSELIAREIHQKDNGRSLAIDTDMLHKTKDTQSQMSIKDKAKRAQNIKGCFAVVDQSRAKGKNIILIDDITTTGATLREARRVLLEAGARRVVAFTVAH